MMRRRGHSQFLAELCDCAREPIQLETATIFEVHQHRRFSVGRYVAVEVAMLRHVVVAEINSFAAGNGNGLRNGIFQKFASIGITHYGSRRLAQHGAYTAKGRKQREFCPHFFGDIGGKIRIDPSSLASIKKAATAQAEAAVVFAENKAVDGARMRDNA